jgi:hypothetical protein
MKKNLIKVQTTITWVCLLIFLGGLFSLVNTSMADQNKKSKQHKQAYALYVKKCLGCHDSVADPEKSGRTRDDWHLVVHVMHGYGMDMSDDEADMIIDLLYDLRRGMEREAG